MMTPRDWDIERQLSHRDTHPDMATSIL